LTLAEDFREARNWFAQHKRDPFLWLVILGPLTFFAINMWGLFVFPPPGAIRAINQVLPNAKVVVDRKNVTKDGSGKKNPTTERAAGGSTWETTEHFQ
jgi:hypothetical protein